MSKNFCESKYILQDILAHLSLHHIILNNPNCTIIKSNLQKRKINEIYSYIYKGSKSTT